MPRNPVSPHHHWIGASTHPLDARSAVFAKRHGWVKVDVDSRVDILDVYCEKCKRFYEEVADRSCEAAESNDHLIGGPTGTRKKRIHDHDCSLFGCTLSAEEAAALRVAAANPEPRRVEASSSRSSSLVRGRRTPRAG